MLDPTKLDKGEEQYECFRSSFNHQNRVQYDYRDYDGELFSTIAPDLKTARKQRDEWLSKKEQMDLTRSLKRLHKCLDKALEDTS